MIAALLLLAAGAAPFVFRRAAGDVVHPAAVVIASWGGTLGLAALGLIEYLPVSTAAWSLIAGGVAALLLGIGAGVRLGRRWQLAAGLDATVTSPNAWIAAYAVLGIAGLAWYVYAVVSRYGWIFANGQELRYLLFTYAIPSRYLFLQQFCVPAGLIAWTFWLTGARPRPVPLLLAAAAAAGTLGTTDRTQFFSLVVSGLFIYLFHHGARLPTRRLLLLTIVAPVILVTNFIVIGNWTGKTNSFVSIQLRWPGAPADSLRGRLAAAMQGGAVLYFYATSPYAALSEHLKAAPPRTYGAHTVYPAARLLQRSGILDVELPEAIPPFASIGTREDGLPLVTNSYTFLVYPLDDFGPSGAVLYAALVGLACGAIYAWMRGNRASPARLLLAGQVSTALALTFFANKFNNTAWWYVLVLTMAPFVAARLAAVVRAPR